MTSKELRGLIRELVREEIYDVLPSLLKEALQSMLTEQKFPKRKPASKKSFAKLVETRPPSSGFDREKMKQLLGYGKFEEELQGNSVPERLPTQPRSIASPAMAPIMEIMGENAVGIDEEDLSVVPSVPMNIIKGLTQNSKAILKKLEGNG